MLRHLQKAGHKPIVLVGGATGMIGDPSGKSEERNLLSEEILVSNVAALKKQLEKFLDYNCGTSSAEIVNNYDWFKEINFLTFLRDAGKHITVNYMLAKDSVQKRLETGISFTEFSYQLVQGYDFYYLNKHKNCKLQMGGSDQWGNIVTGTELIRRKGGTEAYALTCPLITKADGSKFGKTETGTIWLDPAKTSAYKFYQFWINTSDIDASKYIRIFTFLSKDKIEQIEIEHNTAPHLRVLQKALAKEITIYVHSELAYNKAIETSEILFGKGSTEQLKTMLEEDLLAVFEGIPVVKISKKELETGIPLIDMLSIATQNTIFSSKGEAKKMIQAGGVSINKEKIEDINHIISMPYLLNKKYIIVQKGKKNYFLIYVI